MTLLIAFAGGLISCLSPCVLPIIPVFLTQLTGTRSGRFGEATLGPPGARTRALGFLAGFGGVFVALWVSVGLVGFVVLQSVPDLRLPVGLAIILLGLATIAGWRFAGLGGRWRDGRSFGGSFLLGAGVAIGWTPCIGPTLGAILTLAAAAPTVPVGAALLIAYAAGMIAPMLLIWLMATRMRPLARSLARHERALRVVSGALVATGAFARLAALVPWKF